MIDIKNEIRNFKNQKNKFIKQEIADLITEEVKRLLTERNNGENKIQCEVAGDITYEGTLNEMKSLSDEWIQYLEEKLDEIVKELKLLDSVTSGYFDEIIQELDEVLIWSKV